MTDGVYFISKAHFKITYSKSRIDTWSGVELFGGCANGCINLSVNRRVRSIRDVFLSGVVPTDASFSTVAFASDTGLGLAAGMLLDSGGIVTAALQGF